MSSVNGDPETGSDQFAFPATVGQQAFWYLNQLHAGTSAHHIALRFQVTGPLRRDVFDRCIHELCRRHESLRTTFGHDGNQLIQFVSPPSHRLVRFLDLTDRPAADHEIERLMFEEARAGFDLEAGPLIRFAVLKISERVHYLLLTVHHIVSDGWSTGIILKEIAALYEAFERGQTSPLPEPALQFADYSVWEDEWLRSNAIELQNEYWKRTLRNAAAVVIPHDRIHPPVPREGKIESILLPRDLSDALTKWSVEQGATLFTATLACLYLLVYSRTNRTDLSLGTLIAGRTRTELESVVGLFVNTLVLRTEISGDPTFVELLKRVRETVAQAFENQEIPFGRVVESLPHLAPGQSNPLFRINFLYQRAFLETQQAGSVTIEPIRALSPGAVLDLNFFMVQRHEGWRLSCEYSSDEYYPETVLRLLLDMQTLVREIVSDPTKPISAILNHALQRTIGPNSGIPEPGAVANSKQQAGESNTAMPKQPIQADTPDSASERSEFEAPIRQIWEEVLQAKEIHKSSNFFDLGGHSLKAAQLLARLKSLLDVRLTPAWLFQSPTLDDMVNAVQEMKRPAVGPALASHSNGDGHSGATRMITNRDANSLQSTVDNSNEERGSAINGKMRLTGKQNEPIQRWNRRLPYFFSKSNRPLFGVYEPPSGIDRDEGIVLCAPIGHEYMRTHWCLRLLAMECSKLGFHTMRFDFSGIGNSGGVFDNTTVNQWTDDLGEAVRELSIRSGLERVSIVGLRWGAVFAYYYALRNPIHRLILWDPVTVGQSCLTQYRHMNDCVRGYGYPVQDNSTGEDLLGFNYSDRLIADLSRVNLLDSAPPPCATIGFCLTEQSLQSNNLMMQWKSRQSRLSVRIGREDAGWNDPANYDNAILLNEARRSVLEMMQESMT